MSPPRNSVRRGRELHDTRRTTAVSQTQPTGRLDAGEEITRAAVLTFITKQATNFFIVNNA